MIQVACILLAVGLLTCQWQITRMNNRLKCLDALAQEVCEIVDDARSKQ